MFCVSNKNTTRYVFKKVDANSIELEVNFDAKNKLKRWLDLGSYTTYFGFNKNSSYVLGVPEEKPGAVVFLDIKKNGKTISTKE